MSSTSPGDRVSRPKKSTAIDGRAPDIVEFYRESEPMKPEITKPVVRESESLKLAKWKIMMAFAYLAFTSTLCLGTILISPTHEVQVVVCAVWAATSAAGAYLLRKEYRKKL